MYECMHAAAQIVKNPHGCHASYAKTNHCNKMKNALLFHFTLLLCSTAAPQLLQLQASTALQYSERKAYGIARANRFEFNFSSRISPESCASGHQFCGIIT